jgi:hypothetical protein
MDKERKDKIVRLLLRSLPLTIFPGPEVYDLFKDFRRTGTELDKKVEAALESIRNASSTVSELERTLDERTKKLQILRSEVERLSKLAAVEEEKAAPLLRELELLTSKGRTKERIIAFAINILAGIILFALGAVIGPRLFPPSRQSVAAPSVRQDPALERGGTAPGSSTVPSSGDARPTPSPTVESR